MFGFSSKDNKAEKPNYTIHDPNETFREDVEIALARTFGTCNPKGINYIMKTYMPELMDSIQSIKESAENNGKNIIQNGRNQETINQNMITMHKEVMEELQSLRLQNKELQAKYDALVERMAGYIERENVKGR